MSLTFPHGEIYPRSQTIHDGISYALAKVGQEKVLLIQGDATGFETHALDKSDNGGSTICTLSPNNAATLRDRLPWLRPVPLGRATSFGFGDRLGSATPGHIASVRAVLGKSSNNIAPIYAQQSVRENERIGRTPQDVVDDAMWGIFQEGWTDPWGADADHVKVLEDLPPFVAAGYTFYTIDPSDHVDSDADTDYLSTLKAKVRSFPWSQWGTNYADLQKSYSQNLVIESSSTGLTASIDLTFDELTLLRAIAKYGRAILHTASIADSLNEQMAGGAYDLEMSVDETDTPTSIHEHYFIANELLKRNIPVVSLAPRFVGKFQKGIDYMGDLAEFEAELVKHMAILHHFGKYKISVHTGSDKFSIYGIVNQHARGYVHVKTAGTSYLEALRVAASHNVPLFRKCFDLAHQRFQTDRKSYYLDCQPENVPTNAQIANADLPSLFEDESVDARQLIHVTFGSILDTYGEELAAFLAEHEDGYRAGLESHFERHLRPFG